VREERADGRLSNRRVLWWAIGGGVAAVAVAVAGVTLSGSLHPATGRGEPLQALPVASSPVPTVAPVVDGSSRAATIEDLWGRARESVKVPALVRSGCLNDAAKAYAAAAAKEGGTGGGPAAPKTECGGDVAFGYVLGFDESGLSQASAAMTATQGKASPLMADSTRKVGWALVPSKGNTGKVNGYVLAWAVSK
jgi:hypothetical protein